MGILVLVDGRRWISIWALLGWEENGVVAFGDFLSFGVFFVTGLL